MDENERPMEMPQTIGRYQVLENVGYGAMGAVYKAFDPLIKRTLAIKTIRLDIPRNSPQYKSFIDRFYHEARISGTLSHPHIVTLFDIGEENGLPYLAMEFVEGDTISGLLEKGTRFKPEKVISLVSQVASAVDYAHSKGVIHRDIKPSNLILYEGDKVKVTDFGIAKLVDAEMTQSGTLLGTPSYMSPEQAMGEKLDGRSDIFSLGVCAFEMLSGEQPFPGNNVTSILYKLVHVEPVQPTDLEMHGLVPQRWHEVFNRVLAKKPDDRYQTATEFVQDLEYCLGSWFGAVPDITLAESPDSSLAAKVAAPPGAPGARQTGSRPASPTVQEAEPIETTVAMPSPSFEKERPRAGAQEAVPTTMYMSASDVAEIAREAASPTPEAEGTVVMASPVVAPPAQAPAAPRAPEPPKPAVPPPPSASEMEGTVMMASPVTAKAAPSVAPPSAPAEMEGTVMMASPVTAAPSAAAPPPAGAAPKPSAPAEMEGTVMMASPVSGSAPPAPEPSAAPEVEGTVMMAPMSAPPPSSAAGQWPVVPPPPAPSSPAAEGTVMMSSPVASPPRMPPTAPAPAPAGEGTVLMGAPPAAAAALAPPAPVEGTVLMSAPPLTPPPRPAAPPPVVAWPPAPPAEGAPETTAPVEAETAPARRGMPTMLIVGAGGLVLLLGAIALGVVLLRKGPTVEATPVPAPSPVQAATATPPPTAATPPPVVEGSLRVASQPSGATVSVDGVVRGVTPVDVAALTVGPHEVKVELKGYAPTVETIAISAEAPAANLDVALSRTAAPMGTADITSNPPGALIKVNGVAVGNTPLRAHKLKVGSHQVELAAEGFEPWSGTVAVREGRKAKVDAFLRAIPKATPVPTPTPEVFDPNRVYLHTEVDVQPRKISGSSPTYPSGAPKLKGGQSVSVAGTALVSPSGDVTDVTITESGGQVLDATVAAAVRSWRFTPGVKKGVKVKVRMPFRQTFRSG